MMGINVGTVTFLESFIGHPLIKYHCMWHSVENFKDAPCYATGLENRK